MAAVTQSPVPVTNGTSHPFTCNTCQVAFRSSDLQRTHMQSDWHRYNLKRRVASLPPLTSEIFAEKVLANKASAAATAARASFEKICPACSKTYYSENAYQNHLGSQKHKAQVMRMNNRQTMVDDADSMMSSTFSLGEPVETASTISAAEQSDVASVTEAIRSSTLTDGGAVGGTVQAGSSTPIAQATPSAAPDADMDDAEVDMVEVRLNQCLFCNVPSDDVENNLIHMSKQHGMFIPERDYLVDLEGLLSHLHEIIFDLHECLYCRQIKTTAVGAQTHMRDRGHCMIAYSTEAEQLDIGDYYDFRSTYSDDEEEEEEGNDDQAMRRGSSGVKLGANRATKITIEGTGSSDEVLADEDEDGWESDASSLSSVPTDEITSIPIDDHSHRYKTLDRHRHHSHNDPRPHRNFDGFHSHAHTTPRAVYHDDYELHLPSGRVAGHRSFNKYFRQNLHNRSSSAEQLSFRRALEAGSDDEMEDADSDSQQTTTRRTNERDRGRQLIAQSTRETALAGLSDQKKREIRAEAMKSQKKAQRAENRYRAGNERRNNFQKHFRDPLLQ
ncbi:C2H2 type zinc-finger-domain-containing protein [Elsinoe ampelina]|uniref:C2H2 type zinc-finger-domain-containing protein n=1 Tax=Elsinoe ampelina TaxID=302913 RepID=A0A6A6GE54_9PEZI|nr:C2H2 type zinc-finger-domain-containing protein [Elsinoe ampelina]